MERREGLYSGQERCLGAKREWRSMNNAGRTALRGECRIRQALLEEAGKHGEQGYGKMALYFIHQTSVILITIMLFHLFKSQVA